MRDQPAVPEKPSGADASNGHRVAAGHDLRDQRTADTESDEARRAESEQTLAEADQTLSDADRTSADSDQTSADSDQTSADSDQTSADSDQTSADCDQLAADRDQDASDRDLASGVSASDHEVSRDIRKRTARRREQTAAMRLNAAAQRDTLASSRDLAALARDDAANSRDLAMQQRDLALDEVLGARALTGADVIIRAAEQRKRAAEHRAEAAEHRALAAQDRQAAASDRTQAARERAQALADCKELVHQLEIAATDHLTGARTRAAGLSELDHELDRSRRTGSPLVATYVDVVGLKARNDGEGHDAGDELLKLVVARIKEHLRSYDLVIRVGGDEFVCAMSRMTMVDARRRFAQVAAALGDARPPATIRTGFAELAPDENAAELVARADQELIAGSERHGNRGHAIIDAD